MPLDDDAWKRLPYYASVPYGCYPSSPQAQRPPTTSNQYPPVYPGYPPATYASYPPPPRPSAYYYPTAQGTMAPLFVEPTRASYPQRDMLIFDSDLDEMVMLQEMLFTPYADNEEEAKESHVAMLLAANAALTTTTTATATTPTPSSPASEISSCDSQRMSVESSATDSSIASYTRSSGRRSIPPSRICRVPDCTKGIRSRGLCKAHGGGRRCQTPGCSISDQGGGHCIAHGGGKRCTTPGCDKSAQFKGLCKVHGGSRRCRVTDCDKNGQIKGLCRHHYTQSVQQHKGSSSSSGSDHDDSDH